LSGGYFASLRRLINSTFKNNLAKGASVQSLHLRGAMFKRAAAKTLFF
jgi:hypothetical protein